MKAKNNKISIRKRVYLNQSDYANFELYDGESKGCIIAVKRLDNGKTIINIFSIDEGIEVNVSEERQK